MKPLNFTNFLESGALVRVNRNKWILLEGPFTEKEVVATGEVALFHPDFFSQGVSNYLIPKSFYILTGSCLESLCAQFDNFLLAPLEWQNVEPQSFETSFTAVLQSIQAGLLKKAVPIVFENSTGKISSERIGAFIKHLLKVPPSLYVFGSWQNGQGVIGATPEVLLRQEGILLHTMALAGTCPKEDAANRGSLLEDPKERYEHELVVQDISQVLVKYGRVQVAGPKVLELPTLLHLKTEIECQLSTGQDFSFFEVCQALHPTSALGVSPRNFGYEWLKNLPEQKERQGFGAPWGISWSAEEALCLVAIRNIQWNPAGCRIGSGCGLVAQSDFQQEWIELSQKRRSVKKVLGLES